MFQRGCPCTISWTSWIYSNFSHTIWYFNNVMCIIVLDMSPCSMLPMSYSLCWPLLDNKYYHWMNAFNSNDYFSMVHNAIKLCIDYLRKGAPFPQSGYDELDSTLIPPRQDHYRITPSPGGPIDRYGKCIFFLFG